MQVTLYSLYELVETLPSNEYFRIYCGNQIISITNKDLADYEKEHLVNYYIYDFKNVRGFVKSYFCVALPYNYGKGVK